VAITWSFVNAPTTATVGVPFQLTAQVNVTNDVPLMVAVVDTTFTPALATGCTATTGIVTIQNTIIPSGATVFLSRSWMVTCSTAGLKDFGMTITTALDPLLPAVDPDPSDNTASGSDNTQVN
jgi:hypothetical protein